MLQIGLKYKKTIEVKYENTAVPVGGAIEVFGTPFLLGIAEDVACLALNGHLQDGETTVGTWAKLEHTAATPIGMHITCESILTLVDGKKLVFDSIITDEKGEVGRVTHGRYIVNKEKFVANVNKRKE